ncbi:MAG: orotidine-5'-phosphate decarboxylase [Candidatus Hydrothermarchaeota archaeon]
MNLEKRSRVILALDLEEKARALALCEQVVEYIDGIKVGYPLVLASGLDVMEELRVLGKPIIADLKVADIPEISSGICRRAVENGADYVIIHGFLGRDVVESCSKVARVFVVAEMSHPGAEEFMAPKAEKIAAMAKAYAQGIVAPATRPQRIRELRKVVGDLLIISPGVKAQGGVPGGAIKAGADFEIIGRGIYASGDPVAMAREFSEALRNL